MSGGRLVRRGVSRCGIALGILLLCLLGAAPAAGSSTLLFTLGDPRLDEASGIARGSTSPGVFYVHNDSGDSPRFFALDALTGRVGALYVIPGVQNQDWEDIAVAPDSRRVSSVWLADIGDNERDRAEVQIYRVDEPHVDMNGSAVATGAPDVWRLRYPTGPANAESLAVSPDGRAYIVTKSDDGHSGVYAVPPQPDAKRVQQLTRIGAITFQPHQPLVPVMPQVLATGAALSGNGLVFAVRTYTDAYLWPVHDGDVAAALRGAPDRVTLPLQPQGEGVCIDGNDLVVDSEHNRSQVYRVPLPKREAALARGSSHASTPPTAKGSSSASYRTRTGVIVLGVLLVVTGGVFAGRVRRGRRRG